jgi:hypothetical protein
MQAQNNYASLRIYTTELFLVSFNGPPWRAGYGTTYPCFRTVNCLQGPYYTRYIKRGLTRLFRDEGLLT